MQNPDELLTILSTPRPNGSRAERQTAADLKAWLDRRGIPHRSHFFRHDPYFFEGIGAWLIFSRLSLALAIFLRWGWYTALIALLAALGGTLDSAFHLPLVSWIGRRRGENLLIEFSPPDPRRELILSAHYDSKTELLDHRQRMFFLRSIPAGLVLTVLLGILGPLDRVLWLQASLWSPLVHDLSLFLSLVLLVLSAGYGANLLFGRLVRPSQGAVDNGAACAVLLHLAERLAQRPPIEAFPHTRLILALFTGEEVDRQGSAAFARDWDNSHRESSLPAAVLNMEAMAQNGPYVYWEQDGSVFGLHPTNPKLNGLLCAAVKQVTGQEPQASGPVLSDAAPFQKAGLPVAILGTLDSHLGDTGFHRPTDNLERVVPERIPEAAAILEQFVRLYDRQL